VGAYEHVNINRQRHVDSRRPSGLLCDWLQ